MNKISKNIKRVRLKEEHKFLFLVIIFMNYDIITSYFNIDNISQYGINLGAFFLGVILLIMSIGVLKYRLNFTSSPTAIKYYIIFTGLSFLSILWAISIQLAIRDALKLMVPLTVFGLAFRDISIQELDYWLIRIINLMRILLIISLVTIIIGVALGIVDINFSSDTELTLYKSDQVYGASFQLIAIYTLAYLTLNKKKYFKKYDLLLVLLLAFQILLTISRTYIYSFISGVLFIIFMKFYRSKFNIIGVILVGLLLYFLGVFFITEIEPIKERMFWNSRYIDFQEILYNPIILLDQSVTNTSGRLIKWEFYISKLHNYGNSVIGGGIGGVKKVLGDANYVGGLFSHSDYAKYLAELGFVGFSLFLIFVITMNYKLIKIYTQLKNKILKDTALFLAGIMFTFSIGGIGYEVFYHIPPMVILFFLLSLLFGALRNQTKGTYEKS